MRVVFNLLWLVLVGLWLAIGYAAVGVLMCIMIITIPFGVASFRLGGGCSRCLKSPPSRYRAEMAGDGPSGDSERTLEQLRQQIRRIETGKPDAAGDTGIKETAPDRQGGLRRSSGLQRRTPLRRQRRLD